jgi:release factor glutamine methyltransferase
MIDYQIKLLEAKIKGVSVIELLGQKSELTNEQKELLDKQIEMLKSGYPLDYLLNEIEILGLKLKLNEAVLIPRPETEEWLTELQIGDELKNNNLLLDLGCGSGIIGLYLSKFFTQVLAVDISSRALEVAKGNANINKIENIEFFLSDGLSNIVLKDRIQKYCEENKTNWVLVANLPYVPSLDKANEIENKTNYEPDLAIYSGYDGLDLFRQVTEQLKAYETKPQQVIFELDPRNIRLAKILLEGFDYKTNVWIDSGNFERVLIGNIM